MKIQKVAIAVIALAVASASGLAACDTTPKHTEHDYEWTTVTPPTCTEDGEKKGVCSECRHETTEIIPATGHEYGKWQILAMPSKESSGSAVRYCENDPEHSVNVELPAFDRAGIAEYAEYSEDGHYVTFTYAHESGDISATAIASVKDAVELGVENKEAVVSGVAGVFHDYKIWDTQSKGDITYEFGENYLHVKDPMMDKREYFYELNEDGTMFPVYTEWKAVTNSGDAGDVVSYREVLNMKTATSEMLQGFGFFFTWLNGGHKEYGVENFINYIYSEYFEVNANADAKAWIEVDGEGAVHYNFSVSVYSTMTIDILNKINVSFTLDENNVVKTASISNRTWNNPVKDEKTLLWSVPEDSDYVVMDQYNVVQATEREEGAEIPTNPYKLEDMLITSYEMVLDGEILPSGSKLEIDANEVTVINLENIQPATYNLNFDEMTVTLTDSEGNVKDCVPSAVDLSDGEILAQMIARRSYDGETISVDNTLQIKSLLAGDYTLTITTANLTKTLDIKVNTVAPSEFGTTVYDFNPFKSTWESDNYNKAFTVYTGQGLNFTSYVLHPAYEEKGFTTSVSGGESYTVTDAEIDGVSVKKFVATEAGDYTVTLTNIKQKFNEATGEWEDVTVQLTVHVVDAPDMAEVLNGKYFNLDDAVELTFVPSSEGATSGEATLVTGVGGKRPAETVLSYVYTEGEGVALEYVSGAIYNEDENVFSLTFDDAYNMFVSYMTAMGTTRTIYMYDEVPNLIEGTYGITNSSSNAAKLVVNVEGTYSITTNSYAGVYYAVYDKNDRQIGENKNLAKETTVDLEVGQILRVWCIGLHTDSEGNVVGEPPTEYTVTFIPATESD